MARDYRMDDLEAPPKPAPRASAEPPPPPPQDRYPERPAYGPPMFRGNFFSVKVILVLVLIGLILFYVGGMVCLAGINNEKYDYDEMDDREDDRLGAGNIYKAGLIILFVGALLSHIGLFAGGIANKELNPTVRVAMISMGIALLILIVILLLFGPVMRATVGPF